jgi:hypothetical protein
MSIADPEPFDYEFQESPIPAGTFRRLDEATIRRDGCVWRVHRYDPDPFPSNPHAHNVESGLKLDLSSGRLYFGARDTEQSINRKHLLAIRQEAESRGFVLPPLAV